jgi:hypothetical protein
LHFWVGSFCGVLHNTSNNKATFPREVVAASDTITLIEDMGNQIPDKSWMLYLLELFNRQNIPAELNLICSFNNDGKFDAIFNDVNQYQFKQISPIVGHSYIRQTCNGMGIRNSEAIINERRQNIMSLLTKGMKRQEHLSNK